MKCLNNQCRSPVACNAFCYCRERNFDGLPMTDIEVKRRRNEQSQSEQEK